ncbi:MAG: zinc-ribbon and DUF3426 domain-containing protein [Xanthomonadales bacterium]|nr:zinc-ribbon and DUF3426 domain-containing protein [Xanthomonadales bacterium]
MYTQCPQCLSVFAIDALTIALAHGCVGCGECGATFDATATLCDELPEASFDTLPLNDPSASPPLLLAPVQRLPPTQQGLFEHHQPPDEPEDERDVAANPFSRRGRRAQHAPAWRNRWFGGCVALALILVLQFGWAERAALARNPSTRPWLHQLCAALHVPSPMVKDLPALTLLSRDIRRHPSVADALIISATVRNDAHFRQPYPVVSITLSDLDDKRIAMRRFVPAQYLHDPATLAAGLAAGASAALVFEVKDPGQNAVAFEFAFE